MNFAHWLVVLSTIISIAGASAYIRDTLSGKSKPNRVTWGMWALSPLIGAVAALSANADYGLLYVFFWLVFYHCLFLLLHLSIKKVIGN